MNLHSTISNNFITIGLSAENAKKMADFTHNIRDFDAFEFEKGEYLRKEETNCPLTLQIGNGHIFALLKGKVDTVECPKLRACGSYKMVKKVMNVETGELFAQYIFNLSAIARERITNKQKDITVIKAGVINEIHSELNLQDHFTGVKSITSKIYTATKNKITILSSAQFEKKIGDECLSIIMPLAIQNAKTMASNYSPFEVKEMFLDIGQFLLKMHKENIVHGDIKPENIFLFMESGKIVAKLGDFGFARPAFVHKNCGTKWFLHPKFLFFKQQVEQKKMDLWALGVTLFDILHPEEWSLDNKKNKLSFPPDFILYLYKKIITEMNTSQDYRDVYPIILGLLIGSLDMDSIHKSIPEMASIKPIKKIEEFIQEMERLDTM